MELYLSDEKTHVETHALRLVFCKVWTVMTKTIVISFVHLYYLMVLIKLISKINLFEHKKIDTYIIFVSQNLIIIKIYLLISVKGYSGIIPFKHQRDKDSYNFFIRIKIS